VNDEHLSATIELLRHALSVSSINPFPFRLDRVGYFRQSAVDTVHLAPADPTQIRALWTVLSNAVGYKGRPFAAHLTVGQASRKSQDALRFLNTKARALCGAIADLEWTVGSVAVLRKDESNGGVMKLVEEIFLPGYFAEPSRPLPLYPTAKHVDTGWETLENAIPACLPPKFSVATYNILNDPAFPPLSRIDQIKGAIKHSNPDILCLQEVSDELLQLLLSSPNLSNAYIYSSRAPGFTYENERNILVLSKYSFTWSKLEIGGKHKPALLATFLGADSKALNLAAIHLTAGRTTSTIAQKTSELEALTTHIRAQDNEGDWIIIGDTNWPSTHPTTPLDALFEDVASENPQATFDPNSNSLAAQTAREDRLPQRYDRIYLKKGSSLHPSSVLLFGKEGVLPPSDHWGLLVEFEPKPAKTSTGTLATSDPYLTLPETYLSTEELQAVSDSHQWVPTANKEDKFSAALRAIRNLFSSWPASIPSSPATSTTVVKIRIEPVGSFALGVHTSDSDLDCLAVGNISAATFWGVVRTRLRGQTTQDGIVKLRRFVKDAMVQMMELEVDGIKVDLQYCAAARLVDQ
jgi:endonuclease/exonuclease/phosphatase family metal-dependent hydrolase/2'-5' RNA ligase